MSASAVCGNSVKQLCRNRILECDAISTQEDIVRVVSDSEEFSVFTNQNVYSVNTYIHIDGLMPQPLITRAPTVEKMADKVQVKIKNTCMRVKRIFTVQKDEVHHY